MSSATFSAAGRTAELVVRPMRRARGLRLHVDAARNRVLLTMPARQSRRAALAWVEARRPWVEEALARSPVARPFVPGGAFSLGDEILTVDWVEGRSRTPKREGIRLVCGGPEHHLNARVLAWIKREAARLLGEETAEFAEKAAIDIAGVRIGDPRSRWGSCAASGRIAYSWRLILAPAFVRRATVAHEVAHRLHMDHSPAFYAAFADLLGTDPAPARAWLRRNGASLHLFGR